MRVLLAVLLLTIGWHFSLAAEADLILHKGKIVTVDEKFSIAQAIAITNGSIAAIGSDAQISRFKGINTLVIDLQGRTVIPGLMDSHTHPTGASMTEFDHTIPALETIAEVLAY